MPSTALFLMEKLAIVIPAHNEQQRIGPTVKAYLDFFGKLKGMKTELIVVLNACTDRTREVVEQYSCPELKIIEFKRGGKGFAVIEGFKYALKGDSNIIGFVDADMATTPAAYYHLYKSLAGADGVIADRYIKGSVMHPKPTFARRLVSRLYNAVIRAMFVFPYRDTQCGAKIFSRNALKSVSNEIEMTQWAFDVELLYSLNSKGFNIISSPTMWSDKEYSKINAFKAGPIMFLGLVRLRLVHSPFRRFIRVYDFLAEIIRKIFNKK